MPLQLQAEEQKAVADENDSDELKAFKKHVAETATKWRAKRGYAEQIDKAMAALKLDPYYEPMTTAGEIMPVDVSITLTVPIRMNVNRSDLEGKTDEEINAYLTEVVNGVHRTKSRGFTLGTTYVQFDRVGQIAFTEVGNRLDNAAMNAVVTDANIPVYRSTTAF